MIQEDKAQNGRVEEFRLPDGKAIQVSSGLICVENGWGGGNDQAEPGSRNVETDLGENGLVFVLRLTWSMVLF